MTRCLVMCISDPSNDPRPNRAINHLKKEGYHVDILSYPLKNNENITFNKSYEFEITEYKRSLVEYLKKGIIKNLAHLSGYLPFGVYFINRYYENRYHTYSGRKFLSQESYDIIIIEDLFLLPLAIKYKKNAKIIFDAREYYPKQFENDDKFKRIEAPMRIKLCEKYLKLCHALFTVSPGLAEMYKKEYGVDMEVLYSTPEYKDLAIKKTDESKIKMVYHGIANRNRNLTNLINVVKLLDNKYFFDLYLTGDDHEYIQDLKSNIDDCHRIQILEPVKYDFIIPMLSAYDIGFYYLEPIGFNVTYNLPNKFFEFIQARLAIAIGPSPDMARLVYNYNIGFVAPEFSIESMSSTLMNLSVIDIDRAKKNSHKAAKIFNYNNEGNKLVKVIKKIIKK